MTEKREGEFKEYPAFPPRRHRIGDGAGTQVMPLEWSWRECELLIGTPVGPLFSLPLGSLSGCGGFPGCGTGLVPLFPITRLSLFLFPQFLLLSCCPPASVVSCLVLKHARHIRALRPLCMLFSAWSTLPSGICMACSFTPFSSLFPLRKMLFSQRAWLTILSKISSPPHTSYPYSLP